MRLLERLAPSPLEEICGRGYGRRRRTRKRAAWPQRAAGTGQERLGRPVLAVRWRGFPVAWAVQAAVEAVKEAEAEAEAEV